MDKMTGLEKAKQIFVERDKRARELKAENSQIIGYLCSFVPPEIISAGGMVPYRIMGQPADDVVEANQFLESFGCPYVRNCFEQSLKGKLDFLEGVVIAHSCDMVQRIYGPWTYYQKPAYSYLLNVPHVVSPWSSEFFERELAFFKESIEKHTGNKITDEKLISEITISNENKDMVKKLYELRNHKSALTGVEMLYILVAGMSIPAGEFNALLKEIHVEIQDRPPQLVGAPRIMVWGSIIDHPKLYGIIEETGGYVVVDDNCIGTRTYFNQVDPNQSPLKGLSQAYFNDFQCPRTDRGPGTRRFEYLYDLAQKFNVQGVIGYTYAFCDPHKLDYPDLRDYLKEKDIPMLLIDDDYTLGNVGTIKNRVQAFLENLS